MCKVARVARKAFMLPLFAFVWTAVLLVTAHAENLVGANPGQRQVVMENLNRMSLSFTENQGQFGERICFRANSPGGASFFFSPDEVIYQFTRRYQDEDDYFQLGEWFTKTVENPRLVNKIERFFVKTKFIRANPNPEIVGEGLMEHKCNYFIGSDPSKWRTDVPNYSAVRYKNIYPGIDLRYYGDGRSLKYDFIVQPGADPSRIEIEYDGVNSLWVNSEGELVVSTRFGDVIEKVPYAYQEIGGYRHKIPCRYAITDRGRFGFVLEGDWNLSQPLYIDPELYYSTFLGGTAGDEGYGIAVDYDGCAYVTGQTYSWDFPTTPYAYDPALSGYSDAFVTKLDPTGSNLVYSTFLGGSGQDEGHAITVDHDGCAYVTGRASSASSDFPTTPGAYDQSHNGSWDVFVTKLDPIGSGLLYSTFLGGGASDFGYGIALDNSDNAYVTGYTDYSATSNFPTTTGAFDQSHNGYRDVFVTKLNQAGSALSYSTFLGGEYNEEGYDIAVGYGGIAYVTGFTDSWADFPTTGGAFSTTYNGGNSDAFVTKLNSAGSGLAYSTYLGGSEDWTDDKGYGIAVYGHGYAYVTGYTTASDFPTTTGAFDEAYNGAHDVFVTKFNLAGSALIYSTFLGGEYNEDGKGIAVDDYCNAYVTGWTNSPDFPTTPGAYDETYNGSGDAFVSQLNPTGSNLSYSTFLGGIDDDYGEDIALDAYRDAYVTGWTNSFDFPTTPGAFDEEWNSTDVFVTKFAFDFTPLLGYWRFDEGTGSITYDETANDNDGTITGASWTSGIFGDALYFSGGGQFFDGDGVTVPHSTSLDITGEFIVEAWIKATGSDSYLAIVDKFRHQAGTAYGFTLYLNDGKIRLTVYSGVHGQRNVAGTSDLRDNTWHHVAGAWNGSHVQVYADCEMENEAAWDCPPASTTNNLGIGKRLSGYGGYMPFLGVIDEVRISSSGAECGDVNDDEVIDLGDVLYLISYLYKGGPAPDPLWTGDVTCDGIIDLGDVLHLISYLYKGGPPPCG